MTPAPAPSARPSPKPKAKISLEYCKGCGRCLPACPQQCFSEGRDLHPLTGVIPVQLDPARCTGCGLCYDACPEPFALLPDLPPPTASLSSAPADSVPSSTRPVPVTQPLALKGTHAAAIGALFAGCRHFFGYPITPSTEGTELMAKLLPKLGGYFLQAPSEVATVNMMYGCGGAGLPCLTFTSSPGFSLMLEGISYMIGAEVPAVFVNVMRGGPGLGNIGPEQSDIKLACRGLGHGHTHAIVLAPSTPQEMLDLTRLAFRLAFDYRNPVILTMDGQLAQMTGRVRLPADLTVPRVPEWAVHGDADHRKNLITSFHLQETKLEAHHRHLDQKYRTIAAREARALLHQTDDADLLFVACNTPAQSALGAVDRLRRNGVRAGLFQPVTLWPFPIDALLPLLPRLRRLVMVEAGPGQLEDELRLAVSHAGGTLPPVDRVHRFGGFLPDVEDILRATQPAESSSRS